MSTQNCIVDLIASSQSYILKYRLQLLVKTINRITMDIVIELQKQFWDNFDSELYIKYLQAKTNKL